jgi:hypothetical protein
MRIGLVGCVKSKAAIAAPARDLYVSPLFRGRRTYVERTCDQWFVLSALHGLVAPDQVLAPYDLTLADASVEERRRWSVGVLEQLTAAMGTLGSHDYEVHAGASYREFGLVDGLLRSGAAVRIPAEGLSQGEQLAFYAGRGRIEADDSPMRAASGPPLRSPAQQAQPSERGRSSYSGLTDLLQRSAPPVRLTFVEIERLIGRPLPASARKHQAWWANSPSQVLGRTLMPIGWRTAGVDLAAQSVEFRR